MTSKRRTVHVAIVLVLLVLTATMLTDKAYHNYLKYNNYDTVEAKHSKLEAREPKPEPRHSRPKVKEFKPKARKPKPEAKDFEERQEINADNFPVVILAGVQKGVS